MNTTSEFETRLRSWKPRPPSAKVERRLFGRPWALREAVAFRFTRLAPVAAAVVVLWTVATQRNDNGLGGGGGFSPLLASNAAAATALNGSPGIGSTGFAAQTFDWTNGRSSTSSISSLKASRRTNGS